MNLSGANPQIVVGRPLAMPGIQPDGLLFAAAAGAPPDSTDPVDRATLQAAAALGDIRAWRWAITLDRLRGAATVSLPSMACPTEAQRMWRAGISLPSSPCAGST